MLDGADQSEVLALVLSEADAEMQPGTARDGLRAWRIACDIQAAAHWESMSRAELDVHKTAVLDYAEWLLATFAKFRDDNHHPGLQACKLVEDMARRCMQFNATHLLLADKRLLMQRGTMDFMRPFYMYSQETDVSIAWLSRCVNQALHEDQL